MAGLGYFRRFRAAELAHIRSVEVKRPFDCHLLFYMAGNTLRIESVVHGARDLPNRLLENPEGQPGNSPRKLPKR